MRFSDTCRMSEILELSMESIFEKGNWPNRIRSERDAREDRLFYGIRYVMMPIRYVCTMIEMSV